MTREEKIESIMDRCTFTDDEYWLNAMRRGLEIGYDARTEDFKNRSCNNCKFHSTMQGCMGGIMIYDEELEDYIKIGTGFSCNKWESK